VASDQNSDHDEAAVVEQPGRKRPLISQSDDENDHMANAICFNDRREDSDLEQPERQNELDLSISDNEELPNEQEAKQKIE
jgi:hypothetical protein